jgi:hypothetical protein
MQPLPASLLARIASLLARADGHLERGEWVEFLEVLAEVGRLRGELEEWAVRAAQEGGATATEIGRALGVTQSAVSRRPGWRRRWRRRRSDR